MQGKGAGAVNRVELECQVLCAALRQSWVRQDKVGAFTTIRELSHLFPDLLPPPEDRHSGNKANYYEVLSVRPGSGLNGLVVGYLRTVRKFLKDHNPKDYKQFYNSVLNAGFVLRKPRLRLSHDLVVARRWLYESQMEADEQEVSAQSQEESPEYIDPEPTLQLPAAAQSFAAIPPAAATQPFAVTQPDAAAQSFAATQPDAAAQSFAATPPAAATQPFAVSQSDAAAQSSAATPPAAAKSFAATQPGAATQSAEPTQPDTAAHSAVSQSAEAAKTIEASQKVVSEPAAEIPVQAPTLPKTAQSSPAANQFAQESTSLSAAHPSTPSPTFEDDDDDDDYDPLELIQKSWEQAKMSAAPAKTTFEMPAQAAPFVAPEAASSPVPNLGSTNPQFSQSLNIANQETQTGAMQPQLQGAAEARISQPPEPPRPQVVPAARQAASSASESTGFHFDENQLRKPEAEMVLPAIIRLMESAHLITKVEVQALKAQMQLAPNIPADQLMMNAGYATKNELSSLRLAQDLLASGKINMAQFQVAMYDERTSGLRMAESLQVRGWLETEVRNPMEEFKKPES